MVRRVCFVCGHNAGRSQMAQAFFNNLKKDETLIAESAGTNIGDCVNPGCVEAMQEIGIDMTNTEEYFPKTFDSSKEYYKIYSMGCGVDCGVKIDEDLGIADPHTCSLDDIKKIRDDVKQKIIAILAQLEESQ